jgi:Cof subfamily protein (haloacid dehalogenase superfamily)
MIKTIILDVDGVIVGEKIGFNSPYPHKDVIERLKKIRKKGIPISLCTAKPHYSIRKIIDDTGLDNLHITNGGGVIIDPIDNIILKKHIINQKIAKKVIGEYLKNNVYTEFYSVNEYFIQENQQSDLTKIHTHILQRKPHIIPLLVDEADKQDIVKIMPIAKNENDKKKLINIFKPFKNDLTLSWGVHPIALPHLFGIITAKNISKKQASSEITDSLNVKPEEILGIGDSTSDWQFIESCGYGGAIGNANEELKQLVMSKGKERSFIGKSVDENGVIDIFNYFNL